VDAASPAVTALPVVHAVTNDEIVSRDGFVERARSVMRAAGGRGALQLRASRIANNEPARFVELALTLAEEQERTGAWLVINDRVDIALITCARGVQLTTRSLAVTDALQVILEVSEKDANDGAAATAIGASLHSLEEGIAARLGGAAWGVVSDVLASRPSKEADGSETSFEIGPALLNRVVRYAGLPIIAIGGITPQHVGPLRIAGAHGIAAIRGIWDSDHPERAVTDYLSAYDSAVGR
jgi:thiamine-phosphate diphosphorylase